MFSYFCYFNTSFITHFKCYFLGNFFVYKLYSCWNLWDFVCLLNKKIKWVIFLFFEHVTTINICLIAIKRCFKMKFYTKLMLQFKDNSYIYTHFFKYNFIIYCFYNLQFFNNCFYTLFRFFTACCMLHYKCLNISPCPWITLVFIILF